MSAARHPVRLAALGGSALIFAGALAACGTEGDLERPAPLFGQAAQRQYEADRAAGRTSGTSDVDAASTRRTPLQTDNSGRAAGSPPEDEDDAPRTTRDIQDPAQKLTPLSAAPIEGPPNPLGPPVSTRPPG